MSKLEKLLARLQNRPTDFTWAEFTSIMALLGFELQKPGKTAGSRRRFVHKELAPFTTHKPHPGNVLQDYQIKILIERLKQEKVI